MATRYWLIKSEPSSYSIDDLARDGNTFWSGVRNYQARNFMRDEMQLGDLILFYHSNAEPSGVAGIARVCKTAYPDFALPVKSLMPGNLSKNFPTWFLWRSLKTNLTSPACWSSRKACAYRCNR